MRVCLKINKNTLAIDKKTKDKIKKKIIIQKNKKIIIISQKNI